MKAFILYYYSVNTLFRNSSNEDSSITSPAPPNTRNKRCLWENTSQSKNSRLRLPWKSKVKQMLLRWGSGYQRAITPIEQLPHKEE